jgi:hypothetical protein
LKEQRLHQRVGHPILVFLGSPRPLAHKVQSLLKTLPGFVEGFLYENRDGESRYNYMTTVWESEEAFKTQRRQSPRNSKSKVSVFRRPGEN